MWARVGVFIGLESISRQGRVQVGFHCRGPCANRRRQMMRRSDGSPYGRRPPWAALGALLVGPASGDCSSEAARQQVSQQPSSPAARPAGGARPPTAFPTLRRRLAVLLPRETGCHSPRARLSPTLSHRPSPPGTASSSSDCSQRQKRRDCMGAGLFLAAARLHRAAAAMRGPLAGCVLRGERREPRPRLFLHHNANSTRRAGARTATPIPDPDPLQRPAAEAPKRAAEPARRVGPWTRAGQVAPVSHPRF